MSERSTPEPVTAVHAVERGASPAARMEIRVGEHLHVVLEGDPAFVMEAYARVQADIARALRDPVASNVRPTGDAADPEPPAPDEADGFDGEPPAREGLPPDGDLLWVYRCEDELRTVYATRRSRFAATPFARAYGVGAVERIYVEDERLLRALRKDSRTLWRELEPEGLRRIKEAASQADAERGSPKPR